MPQVNKGSILVLLLLISLLLTAGCSSPNAQSQFSANGEKHTSDWLPAGHMTAAKADENSCTECHGSDFSGGISKVSCTGCHLGGVDSVHPQEWSQITGTAHAAYVGANGNTSCANANCHGTALSGVAGSGPSCTSCHLGGVSLIHPAAWDADITLHKNYVASVGSSSCANAVCHGAKLQGVFLSGPSCSQCH